MTRARLVQVLTVAALAAIAAYATLSAKDEGPRPALVVARTISAPDAGE